MTGWTAVATIVALMAVATIGLNASLWMRHKAMAAARGDWSTADFLAELGAAGIDPAVATPLAHEIATLYFAGTAPRLSDRLTDDLKIDPEDLADIIQRVATAAGQTTPPAEPAPALFTIADLARFLQARQMDRTPA